ncbi:MAG: SpoIID/LytB domain-containing protein, partial [Nitriliruptoraceae bacterium]
MDRDHPAFGPARPGTRRATSGHGVAARPPRRAVATLAMAALLATTALVGLPAAPATAQDDDATTDSTDDGFEVRPEVAAVGPITPEFQIHGGGWGHGVGMSQYGAYAMALDDASSSDILTYYYPGTEVSDDDRSSVQRIRVGIRTGQSESALTALDDAVTWQACDPEDIPALDGRVPAGRCTDWFEQPADQRLRVKPLPSAGVAAEHGTQTHVDEDFSTLVELEPAEGEDPNGPIAVPNGGILVERQEGSNWVPHRAYATPDDGRGTSLLPVARAVHGDGRIEAQSANSTERRYAFGWRDLHLVGSPTDTPDDYLLTVVQDVDTVEQYLRGLAEVPASWPEATLQAQAIAGRTYAMRGSRGGACRCDRLATPADQVYIGESKVEGEQGQRWADAVEATRDRVLTYEGDFALTFYSSSHGGRSENVEDSWAYGTTAV